MGNIGVQLLMKGLVERGERVLRRRERGEERRDVRVHGGTEGVRCGRLQSVPQLPPSLGLLEDALERTIRRAARGLLTKDGEGHRCTGKRAFSRAMCILFFCRPERSPRSAPRWRTEVSCPRRPSWLRLPPSKIKTECMYQYTVVLLCSFILLRALLIGFAAARPRPRSGSTGRRAS